jgi:hypothetical protein
MGEFLDQIPESIQGHVREITKTSGLPDNEESVEKIAQGWIEKKKIFNDQAEIFNMVKINAFRKDDPQSVLAITYSGSIVNVSPLENDARRAEYTSIGLRSDVPAVATGEKTKLLKDIKIDEAIEFEEGPVVSTSPIFDIVVFKEDLPVEEQVEKMREATLILQDEFVKVNKTIILE